MVGQKRKIQYSARRQKCKDNRQRQKTETSQDCKDNDRRLYFPQEMHPGSYAVEYRRQNPLTDAPSGKACRKRRYGFWVAYCGEKYSGMQLNEGVATIEAELERALFQAGGISDANYGFLQKIGWSRAARTDKGVHAAGQLVTAKLSFDSKSSEDRNGEQIKGFIEKINASLPSDIRVMDMVTVTKNFNAKLSCDYRTYEYLIPTFVFAGRQRKDHKDPVKVTQAEEIVPKTTDLHLDVNHQQAYRMSTEQYDDLNRILAKFEGSHTFHNFTSKLLPTSPKCQRYIVSFKADQPFVPSNSAFEWIRLRVKGQSFLLHQIRKMIGTAVDLCAGAAESNVIERVMLLDKMDLPKAPSVGLYLSEAHFEKYNLKLGQTSGQDNQAHPNLKLTSKDTVVDAVEAFKQTHIFPHIFEQESTQRTYGTWLETLCRMPFSYHLETYAVWKVGKEEEAIRKNVDKAQVRQAQ
uniref:tRNA pseudouridine synthase putative n=1 Tax=Albugo laibachii Nc14 TaxID=890382 RepID=F0WU32_9STRA|nr:tRNA pseudouridine synthase putative [Albugo laibachii Nc14]|eukprot:CCA24877.1 tRNA pseudouridine synthase putative [Albugo laibachii Nc14]